MTPPLDPRASRRGVLGGLVLGLTAVGCELGEPGPGPADQRGPADVAPSPDDPDAVLVRRVVADLTAALALASGLARAGRALAEESAPWRVLHDAHLTALEASARVRPLRVRGTTRTLRERFRREEAALQRRLAAAAVSARSGALAALLATMSAAVAQQLAADAERSR